MIDNGNNPIYLRPARDNHVNMRSTNTYIEDRPRSCEQGIEMYPVFRIAFSTWNVNTKEHFVNSKVKALMQSSAQVEAQFECSQHMQIQPRIWDPGGCAASMSSLRRHRYFQQRRPVCLCWK